MSTDLTDVLDGAYRRITEAVGGLGAAELMRGSRCAGWVVGDVLYHQLLDARRALCAFATPETGPADVDELTYWRPFRPGGEGAGEHARYVRIAASAYSPAALIQEWTVTSAAAVRAARACPHPRVGTQGHVLSTTDFVSTLVVEATVHHLDLTVELPDAPGPGPDALRLTRRVLDGILGAPAPVDTDDRRYVITATGRVPLTDAERTALGPHADRFPLLG